MVATFTTAETSLVAPVPLFETGKSYVVRIMAGTVVHADPLATPNRQALPSAVSILPGGTITP